MIICSFLVIVTAGCRDRKGAASDARTVQADRQVRARWGKGLDELPTVRLIIVSPHNENIINEFEWAFSLHHAIEFGQKVDIVERAIGGGGSSIEKFLLSTYSRSDSADIDVLWGGGDMLAINLAKAGLLAPMTLNDDVLANVPASFGGLPMLEEIAPAEAKGEGGRKFKWVGTAVSGFGFLYNAGILKKLGVQPPQRWEDLAGRQFADLLALTDPGQSASAAAAYRMIVQTEPTWPAGWARLLRILANVKRFADSAGGAANAPVLGEAPVATCIDFYGIVRVWEDPNQLVYISPHGQTTFSCDPISILKNPPHGELAQRFVDFVMSNRGQALWALPVGQKDGPVRFVLGRQPIRRDVYEIYAGKLTPRIINPYQSGQAMEVGKEMQQLDFGMLRRLIVSGILDNVDKMRSARNALNRLQADPNRAEDYRRLLAEFNRLPDNIDSLEKMPAVAEALKDPRQSDAIARGWRNFFADKFDRITSQR